MPNFTGDKVDRAYESFMKQIPGFQRDPPEAEIIQRDLERRKSTGKERRGMIFRNDRHKSIFEREIQLHEGSVNSLAAPTNEITAALFGA